MKKILFTSLFAIQFFIFSQAYSVPVGDVVLLTSKMRITSATGSFEGAIDVQIELIKENATKDSTSETPTSIGITYVIPKIDSAPVYKKHKVKINNTTTIPMYDTLCTKHFAWDKDSKIEITFYDRRNCYWLLEDRLSAEVTEKLENQTSIGSMLLIGNPD